MLISLQVNVKNIQEKLVVAVFGYEIDLATCSVREDLAMKRRKVLDENDEDNRVTFEGDKEYLYKRIRCHCPEDYLPQLSLKEV